MRAIAHSSGTIVLAVVAGLALLASILACAPLLPGYSGVCERESKSTGEHWCVEQLDGPYACRSGEGAMVADDAKSTFRDADYCDEIGYTSECLADENEEPTYENTAWATNSECDFTIGPDEAGDGGTGSCGGAGTRKLTCDTKQVNGQCVEYTVAESDYESFRSQCESAGADVTAGSHACSSAPSCEHCANGRLSRTYEYNVSSPDVRSGCEEDNGNFVP